MREEYGLDDDAEIFLEEGGVLYDFDLEQVPEVFDGFDTVYPQCLKIVNQEKQC